MFGQTVTVFNCHRVKKEITWYPAVLHNAEIQISRGINIIKTGMEDANRALLIVHTDYDGSCIMADGLEYKKPKEWSQNEIREGTFTFAESLDFFVPGDFSGPPIHDADYSDGFYGYMNSRHDDVFMVKTVGFFHTIPHLEIGGA